MNGIGIGIKLYTFWYWYFVDLLRYYLVFQPVFKPCFIPLSHGINNLSSEIVLRTLFLSFYKLQLDADLRLNFYFSEISQHFIFTLLVGACKRLLDTVVLNFCCCTQLSIIFEMQLSLQLMISLVAWDWQHAWKRFTLVL